MFLFSKLFELPAAFSYRRGMRVHEMMLIRAWQMETPYYVCPRCRHTMEREFMKYCDRCGQCLDWSKYLEATVVLPGKVRSQGKGPDFAKK